MVVKLFMSSDQYNAPVGILKKSECGQSLCLALGYGLTRSEPYIGRILGASSVVTEFGPRVQEA